MKVEVYWNIRKKCWSVRHNGKVIQHRAALYMKDVQWVVQPGGRARVLRDHRKNVHAFARGTLLKPGDNGWILVDGYHPWEKSSQSIPVRYDPYEHKTFVTAEMGRPIERSDYATLTTKYLATHNNHRPSAYAHGPTYLPLSSITD
jgi:hypothetical protein